MKLFLIGCFVGIIIIMIGVWLFRGPVLNAMNNSFGYKNIDRIVVLDKKSYLYQDGEKIGELYPGVKLEFDAKGERINYYSLVIGFDEPARAAEFISYAETGSLRPFVQLVPESLIIKKKE